MFRLTREVRFAVNAVADDQLASPPTNSYAGYPSLTGLGHFFTLQVTVEGNLDPLSSYLLNIKQIDQKVREIAIPAITQAIHDNTFSRGGTPPRVFDLLRNAWPGATLSKLRLSLTPFLSIETLATEHPMIRLSQKFEFSASHRLHNPNLSDADNRATYGKCNNPHGHGHNYELQVTLSGTPDDTGVLIDIPTFERTVAATVIDRFDHKNLNEELPEFRNVIPSVENIARVIYTLLKPKFATTHSRLASVTVWETPKTWCEYSE